MKQGKAKLKVLPRGEDAKGYPFELVSAVEEMFPDRDPEDILSEFRKLSGEHYRRMKQIFH